MSFVRKIETNTTNPAFHSIANVSIINISNDRQTILISGHSIFQYSTIIIAIQSTNTETLFDSPNVDISKYLVTDVSDYYVTDKNCRVVVFPSFLPSLGGIECKIVEANNITGSWENIFPNTIPSSIEIPITENTICTGFSISPDGTEICLAGHNTVSKSTYLQFYRKNEGVWAPYGSPSSVVTTTNYTLGRGLQIDYDNKTVYCLGKHDTNHDWILITYDINTNTWSENPIALEGNHNAFSALIKILSPNEFIYTTFDSNEKKTYYYSQEHGNRLISDQSCTITGADGLSGYIMSNSENKMHYVQTTDYWETYEILNTISNNEYPDISTNLKHDSIGNYAIGNNILVMLNSRTDNELGDDYHTYLIYKESDPEPVIPINPTSSTTPTTTTTIPEETPINAKNTLPTWAVIVIVVISSLIVLSFLIFYKPIVEFFKKRNLFFSKT